MLTQPTALRHQIRCFMEVSACRQACTLSYTVADWSRSLDVIQ